MPELSGSGKTGCVRQGRGYPVCSGVSCCRCHVVRRVPDAHPYSFLFLSWLRLRQRRFRPWRSHRRSGGALALAGLGSSRGPPALFAAWAIKRWRPTQVLHPDIEARASLTTTAPDARTRHGGGMTLSSTGIPANTGIMVAAMAVATRMPPPRIRNRGRGAEKPRYPDIPGEYGYLEFCNPVIFRRPR